MSGEELSRNNHFVPQMYLSKWLDENGCIFVYQLLVSHEKVPYWNKKNTTKTIASLPNLYVRFDSGEEKDDIEKEFDSLYENPAKEPIEKICTGKRMSPEDWKKVTAFMCAQYVRTPAFHQFCYQHYKKAIPEFLDDICDNLEENLKSGRILPKHESADIPRDLIPLTVSKADAENDDQVVIEIETVLGKSIWLLSMKLQMKANSQMRTMLDAMKWSIVTIDPSVKLPTTDNPFVIATLMPDNSFRVSHGIGIKGNYVLFPVSPSIVLIGSKTRVFKWRICADREFSQRIKRAIIDNAFFNIYSCFEDPDVPEIRPRLVDRDEYQRITEEYSKWHENYIQKEVPYLNQNQIIDKTSK